MRSNLNEHERWYVEGAAGGAWLFSSQKSTAQRLAEVTQAVMFAYEEVLARRQRAEQIAALSTTQENGCGDLHPGKVVR